MNEQVKLWEDREDKREGNNNVTKGFNTRVYEQIQRFLRTKGRNSKHTAKGYEGDIRSLFNVTRNKDIRFLREEDLKFTFEEMEDYYAYLLDKRGLTVNSANRHITSIRELFKRLRLQGLVDDTSFTEIELASKTPNSYGILTLNEVHRALDLVLKQGNKDVALIKYYLIRFAVDTSARLNDCLTIKWDNFIVDEASDVVRINMIGKGNKEFKPSISKSFYNELLKLKQFNSDRVFNIHRNTVQRMMEQLRKDMRIPKSRNITFHSFKKVGVDYVWKKTRDMNLTRRVANHSSMETTGLYIDREEDYGVLGYFSSADEMDNELYKKVESDLLRRAISKLDKAQQMYINLKINELMSK